MTEKTHLIDAYLKVLNRCAPEEILERLLQLFGTDSFLIANSLQAEDQVLLDMAIRLHPRIKVITIDTGRLPQETFELIQATEEKYRIKVEVLFPDTAAITHLVNTKGVNSFYTGVADRKECCYIRKVAPLKKRLAGLQAWVCGLRREQSVTRILTEAAQWDEQFGLIKVNPLVCWSYDDVWAYIRKHQVPYHRLYDEGYTSIGCAPCSRAIQPGEDLRSGRWWWEEPEKKECGIHQKAVKKGES